MNNLEYKHIPVLAKEAIDYLNIKSDGIYVDCTLGGGGHSSLILKKLTSGKLIAFDQDDYAIKRAGERLSKISDNFHIIKSNFVNLASELNNIGITKVDGILYDLGVSSFQFDIPERGFSYQYDTRLDMRMDTDATLDAHYVINNYSEQDLKKCFYTYGEEKFAPAIAKKIVQYRQKKTIDTTFELVDIIKSALPAFVLRKKGHPAKQVFQALRIEVNQELNVFEKSLNDAYDLLNSDGRIVVITFHSLEDRICKQSFKKKVTLDLPKDLPFVPEGFDIDFELLTNKAVVATPEELEYNNRAHSAKLRAIKRK